MYPTIPKRKRLLCMLLTIVLTYVLYTNINSTNVPPPQKDRKRFDVSDYTHPLMFNIREVVERHLHDNSPLPPQHVNPHPYSYYYSPSPCDFTRARQPYTLVLVKSFVGNIDQRLVLRKLASNATRSNIKLVFMLGLGDKYEDRIIQENITYGDLIQENFTDAYSNNTLKTIMGFNWATQYCSEARLLVFLDDDYYVKWDKMTEFLYRFRNLFFGKLVTAATPYRDIGSAWYVDTEVYPFGRYPPYLTGGAYVVTYDVSRKFKIAFPYVRYIGVDDAYLGIVAKILSISPMHCTELSRIDSLSIAKECSHIPSELSAAKCQTRPNVSIERVAKEFEYAIKKFIDLLKNVIVLIQKSLVFFQYVVTFGKL